MDQKSTKDIIGKLHCTCAIINSYLILINKLFDKRSRYSEFTFNSRYSGFFKIIKYSLIEAFVVRLNAFISTKKKNDDMSFYNFINNHHAEHKESFDCIIKDQKENIEKWRHLVAHLKIDEQLDSHDSLNLNTSELIEMMRKLKELLNNITVTMNKDIPIGSEALMSATDDAVFEDLLALFHLDKNQYSEFIRSKRLPK